MKKDFILKSEQTKLRIKGDKDIVQKIRLICN